MRMNSFIRNILILSFAIASYSCFAQDCEVNVTVKTDKENIDVFIDNVKEGNGNSVSFRIPQGTHILELKEQTGQWNPKYLKDILYIDNCEDLILNYSLNNKIRLDSEPQNAYVFENDSLIGYTPLFVNPDFKSLFLSKPGYLDKEIYKSDITPGEKITLEFIGKEKRKNFYESTLFKVLVGTALALGTVTAYTKLHADNKFEEYQFSGDPDVLDEVDKFDIISGTTFVALQINFGLIVYFFLAN